MVQVGQKVIQHVTPILNCDGYNLVQNTGEVAGQTVFHFHPHLIPRYKDADNSNVLTTGHVSFSDEEAVITPPGHIQKVYTPLPSLQCIESL